MKLVVIDGNSIVNRAFFGVRELSASAEEIFSLNAAARDFYVLGYEAAEERTGGSDWRQSPITM